MTTARQLSAPSEAVKKTSADGPGRRNRLPHHGRHTLSQGGAGGSACVPGFFHSFSRSRLRNYDLDRLIRQHHFAAAFRQ
jgi:hypothetical protein